MPNPLKDKPVTQNLVANAIWKMGAFLIGALTSYSGYVHELPLYKALIVGSLVILILGGSGYLFSLAVARFRQPSQESASNSDREQVTTLSSLITKLTDTVIPEKDKTIQAQYARIRELEDEVRELQNSRFTFELDEARSNVRMSGGGQMRRIEAHVKLRCGNASNGAVAVKTFIASLCKEGQTGEETLIPSSDMMVSPGSNDMTLANGWTITEPLTPYRDFIFLLPLSLDLEKRLARDHFLRITARVVGYGPPPVDFYVNDWKSARASQSGITLKQAERL
jgi:hypothetical protein